VCEWIFRPLAHPLVLGLARLRVPPPLVVVSAGAVGVAAAVELGRGSLLVAAVLVQLKTLLDNADGQLARLSGRVTAFGRYLDSECDLLVDAALFAALGWYAARPGVALAGFLVLTAVLSLNFNLERLARATPAADEDLSSPAAALARVYAFVYGWQDALIGRLVDWRLRGTSAAARLAYHDPMTVTVLANLGMSTQLAALGICVASGHPVAYVWLLLGELVLVAALLLRREMLVHPRGEVSLEHR
jgi:archaetidylinositol phosphate synthase